MKIDTILLAVIAVIYIFGPLSESIDNHNKKFSLNEIQVFHSAVLQVENTMF